MTPERDRELFGTFNAQMIRPRSIAQIIDWGIPDVEESSF